MGAFSLPSSFNRLREGGYKRIGNKRTFADFINNDWGNVYNQPAENPPIVPQGPQAPTQMQRLEHERNRIDNPPELSTKQRLFAALSGTLPTALGAIFGGEAGAAGAATGTTEYWDQQRALEEARRQSLIDEIEAEKERQGREKVARIGAESRESVAGLKAEIDRAESERKAWEGQQKIAIAKQRADAYASNIESLGAMRTQDAEIRLGQLEAQINRDENLDEYRKAYLQNSLEIARMNIAQRKEEEAGRTGREGMQQAGATQRVGMQQAGATERTRMQQEGAMARVKFTQDQITDRQKQLLDKGWSPEMIGRAWNLALQSAQEFGYWDNMNADAQADLVQGLADSFLSQSMPELTSEPATDLLGGMFGRKQVTAEPGEPVVPRVTPRTIGPGMNAAPEAEGETYYNPETGERIRWDGTRWVPVTQ
jgi:hypothetical protein